MNIIGLQANSTHNTLKKRYPNSEPNIPTLMNSLTDNFILTEDIQSNHNPHHVISHYLLTVPIFEILNQSERDIQKAQRWLQNYSNTGSDTYLSEEQLEVITQSSNNLPLLTESEKSLLSISKGEIQRKKNRRTLKQAITGITVLLVLVIGFTFISPYMLLFLILMVVLYDA